MEDDAEVLEQKRAQLRIFQQDYFEIKNLLAEFPKSKARTAMVPHGNVAFMEATFTRTDEIMVALGCEYFAQCSATEAIAVVDRRLESGAVWLCMH